MGANTKSQEEMDVHKPVMLFGRDVTEIPCFRKSFLCGIWCGVAGGLACFLGTSKALFSTHCGFASLWIGVFAYWIPCRYKYETTYIRFQEMKGKINTKSAVSSEK